jgi:hypothetical protein
MFTHLKSFQIIYIFSEHRQVKRSFVVSKEKKKFGLYSITS